MALLSELVVRAQQQRFLRVAAAAHHAVHVAHARRRWRRPLLQRGLLRVLLVGRREVVDGVLDHVSRVHGLLQAAGDALHWGRAAYRMEQRTAPVHMVPKGKRERFEGLMRGDLRSSTARVFS